MSISSIDDLLAHLQSFQGWQDTPTIIQTMKAAPHSILLQQLSNRSDPLSVLDPATQSIVYYFILMARLTHGTPQRPPNLIPFVIKFLSSASPSIINQISGDLPRFTQILTQYLGQIPLPIVAVEVLSKAIGLWGRPGSLTPLHPHFAKFCLLAKTYHRALPILNTEITEVDPKVYGASIQDYLLYHYYGGILLIGCEDYERAARFFEMVVSAPALAVSAIQLEAYQKWVFAALLRSGRLPTLPKYTSIAVSRAIRNMCTGYIEFGTAYESLNAARIEIEFSKAQDIFAKHNNLGLAKLCVAALTGKAIQQLTDTYLTLSLEDISKSVGLGWSDSSSDPGAAEHFLLRMIEDGEIFAAISHADGGMVSFQDSPETYDTAETMDNLHRNISEIDVLNQVLSRLERDIVLSREYVNKTIQGERAGSVSVPADDDFDGREDSVRSF
ncbi:uncharacterized protein BJ171DRAFT_459553 [Polychytrium aggregatum]|uniref:uncharacterized protein n=1 Tax=Polychytrium aggregatum TaxID=110093 RepID=UPI0022FE9240|nr:uncharacterized protein BJ171DRAFT_459553 [Polychytrium aggregatum]KAI9204195.1 hypothetical protein BJ171DRAFT_459553 [Polychytrium aggregatum]